MEKVKITLDKINAILKEDGMELRVNPNYTIVVQELPQQAPKVEEPKVINVEVK
jgi:hypothetical protein